MTKDGIYTLIIDSDPESQKHTKGLLRSIPFISGIDCVSNSDKALPRIIDRLPNLILLEYPTTGRAGNEFINFIKAKLPETIIVFISNTKEDAAEAIRNEIFNFLLKPITIEGLKQVTEKALVNKQANVKERINQIIEQTPDEVRIKFQTTKGYLIADPGEILYCKAVGIFTEFFLTDDRVELSYIGLWKLEETLNSFNFLRVSRSYLINWKYVRKLNRSNGTIVLAFNGKEHEIKGTKQMVKDLCKFGDK